MDTETFMEKRDRLLKSLVDSLDNNDIWALMAMCREKLGQKSTITDYEEQLVKDGHAILAIKSIRHRTLLGLRECKEIYDAYRASTRYQAYVEAASAQAKEPVED